MQSKDYIQACLRTESDMMPMKKHNRLLHGTMGLNTESGEILDAVKKVLFYGQETDFVNIKEEMGDIFWYLAILCDQLGTTFEELMAMNVKKLITRYPSIFTPECALVRSLEEERKVLEGDTCGSPDRHS